MHRVLRLAGIVTMSAALFGACGSSAKSGSSGGAGANTVALHAKDFSYSPTVAHGKSGQMTLVIDNTGSVEHNLTVDDLKINKDLPAGKSATIRMAVKPGTYAFHCEYHPTKMKGTITITG